MKLLNYRNLKTTVFQTALFKVDQQQASGTILFTYVDITCFVIRDSGNDFWVPEIALFSVHFHLVLSFSPLIMQQLTQS